MSDEWDLEHETPATLPEGVELEEEIDLDDASTQLAPTELIEPMDDEAAFEDFDPDELRGDAAE